MSEWTFVEITRAGPVFLWWSEHNDAAVIGPKQGAWGGDNIYRCDRCPQWQSDGDEKAHAATHGYFLSFLKVYREDTE